MLARAWLAIALSYVLGFNAFLLAAAPAHADAFGVICAQDHSAPNQKDHRQKGHPCCAAARCCAGALLLDVPRETPPLVTRFASEGRRDAVPHSRLVLATPPGAFEARGPPQPV